MDRLLGLLTAAGLPAWAAATALHPRWRRDWRERWGVDVPPVQPGAVWVHAASVGEVAAAEAVIDRLPRPVLLTADTDTGAARARAVALARPGVAGGVRPVDHVLALAPLWAEARPRAVVFVEGTFWPALAWRARRAGIPVMRVAAKAGPRTRAFRPLLRAWWAPVTDVLARDADAAAFLASAHGAPVEVGGDPKADGPVGPPVLRWARPFAVGASLRDGDAERLLAVVDPGLALLLAPRRPLAFDPGVLAGRRWRRRTELTGGIVPPEVDVVVLDTLGELARCYAGAAFAFVGGTFDPAIGGHSPLEAARAGVATVAGPHIHAHAEAFRAVGASVDPDLRAAIARAAPPRIPAGAAARIATAVVARLGPPAPESSPRPWAAPVAAVVAMAAVRLPRRTVRLPVPVVSVGSTNARSPGRTSTVRALVGALRARGHVVGVAVPGYRRGRPGRDVRLSSDPADVGDEGALLAAAGALVAAGPDRAEAGRRLVAAGATVVLLDDALRHRHVHRDLDLAVVDARYPGARGPIPMGERRGLALVPSGVDLVLVHHGDGVFSYPGEPVARIAGPWVPGPPVGPVAAFCGIGRAADFLASLEVPVARFRALRDHAPLDAADLVRWAEGLPLVCTAKDAVRAPSLAVHARDVDVVLPDAVLARLPWR